MNLFWLPPNTYSNSEGGFPLKDCTVPPACMSAVAWWRSDARLVVLWSLLVTTSLPSSCCWCSPSSDSYYSASCSDEFSVVLWSLVIDPQTSSSPRSLSSDYFLFFASSDNHHQLTTCHPDHQSRSHYPESSWLVVNGIPSTYPMLSSHAWMLQCTLIPLCLGETETSYHCTVKRVVCTHGALSISDYLCPTRFSPTSGVTENIHNLADLCRALMPQVHGGL